MPFIDVINTREMDNLGFHRAENMPGNPCLIYSVPDHLVFAFNSNFNGGGRGVACAELFTVCPSTRISVSRK
jgi:hypothetical protein